MAPAVLKDEDLNTTSQRVFPSNQQESSQIPADSNHLAQIPSSNPSSPHSLEALNPIGHSLSKPCTPCTQYQLDTKGSLPAVHVPDVIVPKIIVSKVSNVKTVYPRVVKRLTKDKTRTQKALNELHESHTIVPQDSASKICTPEVTVCDSVISEIKLNENNILTPIAVKLDKDVHREIKKEPDEVPQEYLSTAKISQVKDESLTIKTSQTAELPVGVQEIPESKQQLSASAIQSTGSSKAVLNSLDLTTDLPEASLPGENKEMVRLIQEADTKVDSFCHKRSSRVSKRISSSDFDVIELKPGPVSRVRRCTRTRKCSCRSDKSESETSDSRSVADESLYFDMVDKTAKPGKPKNGEPLLDEATTHISAKFNGDVSSEIANGAHKVKGRRVSRANSDESDSNSALRSNGNIDHNGDKVDFSVLLEISPADRKKFESKKAKIRRKTADWLLISETEQYYNEKEEIMRNKNKLESESESDDSDTCTEQQDSRSDCSDESESIASTSQRNRSKGKPTRTIEDDSRPSANSAKRPKDDQCSQRKRGRPAGSRNRKTLYDLTMLNDDDDDDENFFGFPVSTTIPQSTRTSSTLSGSISQTRSKTKESCKHSFEAPSSSGKAGRKRLSDAERFLRDNREYYHFQETPERLRRSTSSSAEKEKTGRLDGCEVKQVEKKEESKLRDPPPPVCKKQPAVDGRRVTRSAGIILEEPELQGKPKLKVLEKDDTKCSVKNVEKDVRDRDKRKFTEDSKKKCPEDDQRKDLVGNKTKAVDEGKRINNDVDKKGSENRKDSDGRKTSPESENRTLKDVEFSKADEGRTKEPGSSNSSVPVVSNSECIENKEKSSRVLRGEARENLRSELQDLYFSFEGVPEQESWYQTYQRLIDGVSNNEFTYEEDPLKFVLPYEMPKEYVRDFLCYKKGMLAKKKNDLADLVRKSPRCHASTLALFSDIIPTRKIRNAKVLRSAPTKVEEVSSDGTSTPGAESTKLPPHESFETAEELAILAMHIDHIMRSEGCCEEAPLCVPPVDDLKETEVDYKKTPPKKRGKRKRLMAGSKTEKGFENAAKELKLFDSSLAQEVDPVFIAGLCDDMKDFLIPENILAREASEVVEDSCFCVCTDRASCDEFSSADDNTEASSECVSLCDSETIDCSVVSEPKRGRSAKKRRKNLTGWPKTQKRKKPVPSHTSDDNDSAMGWDDLEPKKHRGWKKHNFSLLEQTTSERLAALAACDRRASPRKKASVLYMDTWPVRFRTQK